MVRTTLSDGLFGWADQPLSASVRPPAAGTAPGSHVDGSGASVSDVPLISEDRVADDSTTVPL